MNDQMDYPDELELSDDVTDALLQQDRALALVERLRSEEPLAVGHNEAMGGGRRDFRRWPIPTGVALELHDEIAWQPAACLDLGVGGARVKRLPDWMRGPAPARLSAPGIGAVIVLADVMWRTSGAESPLAGLRFEFQDDQERDRWSGALIDALLAGQSLA